jgi:glyoxylase-like metal-dependent hydrolase (beta-lactamase superfamily II)
MSSIITIDCEYVKPGLACAYLIVDGGRAVFVENNTSYAIPLLLQALEGQGLTPDDVDYAIITHVHLDHAGGSGKLLEACKNAQLLAHPRAARHVIDPTRLVDSARQVYGEEFDRLYGEILPVQQDRVRIMNDGEELSWQSRSFRFIYTRGHANHHFCIYDSGTNGIFTGDSFGIAYPELGKSDRFIFPTSTPTDFDPEEAILSLDKIIETGADKAYLTHFGEVGNLPKLREELEVGLIRFREIAEAALDPSILDGSIQEFCEKSVREYFQSILDKKSIQLTKDEWTLLNFDVVLNAQGLAFWAMRKRRKQS